MTTLQSFNVSDILQKLADQEGANIEFDNIDDIAYGMVITADKSLNDVLTQHALPYNYQIVDGDPIRVVRRAINSSLVIDYEINQVDCVPRAGSAVTLQRVDLSNLPRQVEVQYSDPDRQFGTGTQTARHPGAPTTNPGVSFQLDFVITGEIARALAFDILYRIWSQQLSVTFEHKDITIEPGDVIRLTCDQGVFTVLVQDVTYTPARTVAVAADVLLTSSGITIAAGVGDISVPSNIQIETAAWLVTTL